MMSLHPFCVFLDPGHGGLHPVTMEYTTSPDKQYQHAKGEFHCDGWFYEGVSNRILAYRMENILRELGVPCFVVAHDWHDTPLEERVQFANAYAGLYEQSIYVSVHSNAYEGGKGRGWEIFTDRGENASDRLAECIYLHTRKHFGTDIIYRTDRSDGDADKEAGFFVLRNTQMPAVLVEYLFFDNYEEALKLTDPLVQDGFAKATVAGIIQYYREQKTKSQ